MSFFRHWEIYQVSEHSLADELLIERARPRGHALAHRLDESPVGYSLAGCSPAEPASASPTGAYSVTMEPRIARKQSLECGPHLNLLSHFRGAPQSTTSRVGDRREIGAPFP